MIEVGMIWSQTFKIVYIHNENMRIKVVFLFFFNFGIRLFI